MIGVLVVSIEDDNDGAPEADEWSTIGQHVQWQRMCPDGPVTTHELRSLAAPDCSTWMPSYLQKTFSLGSNEGSVRVPVVMVVHAKVSWL